jgi:hypothetical protein
MDRRKRAARNVEVVEEAERKNEESWGRSVQKMYS